jgi:signal transduction histidine kinase/ActR/RegA family two-component response regulator
VLKRPQRRIQAAGDGPEKLSPAETRYRNIFQHSAVSLWEEDIAGLRAALKALKARGVVDLRVWLDSHPDFLDEAARLIRVVDVNEATLALYEVAKAESLKGPLETRLDLRDPMARASMRDNVLAVWEDKKYCAAESNAVTTSGKRIDIDIRMYIPPEDDPYPYMLVSVLDISARVKAEIALRRSEEELAQARKMEAVGRLAGGVAHDFNNLITVIRGYAELVEESLPEGAPARADMREVKRAADRAADLTAQLLAFSRKQILQPRVVNLNEIVRRMEKMLPHMIGEDLELVMLLQPDAGNVRADQGQIEQVIMNLAANARDAMPRGGTLSFQTANLRADDALLSVHPEIAPGEYVTLTVTDTGTGMGPQTIARIFEPFFTTKELGKGTGLGLATVYGIIKQSGGYIYCASELGKGTSFQIHLPKVLEARSADPNNPSPESENQGGETILLVEDEEALRRYCRAILAGKGYSILEAASGDEALEVVRSTGTNVHLLLADVVMPHLSGPELGRKLRVLQPDVKFLYMTGYSQELASRNGSLGADADLIEKPFDSASLLARVRKALSAR